MKRFKNILLVCDQQSFHPAIFKRAVSLAKANSAKVTLIDVAEGPDGDQAWLLDRLSSLTKRSIEQDMLAARSEHLQEVAARLESEGIETAQVMRQGVVFIEIIRQVLRAGHDLVMKGVTGEGESRFAVFGSTDLHLMRKCPCPVWLMKRSPHQKFGRVLAAVDPSGQGAQRKGLDKLILDLATSLSKADGSELHVVHAWQFLDEDSMRNSAFAKIPKAEIDRLVEEERAKSQARLDELMADYPEGAGDRDVHLLKGDPTVLIPELAREKAVELIIMGTVGRTGIQGFFIGNTAEAILNQVDCSVLTVKPAGFQTPVRLEEQAESPEAVA